MKKELEKINKIINHQKKVDLKIANNKYSLTFKQNERKAKLMNGALEPLVLGVSDQSEMHVMLSANDIDLEADMESLIQQIKVSFSEYLENMKQQPFKGKTFNDILYKEEVNFLKTIVQVDVLADRLVFKHDEIMEIKYQNISTIYVERKTDLSKTTYSKTENKMKYALQYENWVIIEADNHVYAFSGSNIEQMFNAISQAFFMAQIKNKR